MSLDPVKEASKIAHKFLDKYNIDTSVIDSLSAEIVRVLSTPERKGIGGAVMTAESSAAWEKVRRGEIPAASAKPQVF